MNITVISKVLLVLIVHSWVAAIVPQTPQAQHITRIYEAGIDILTTCYGDLHNTVGISGNSDGSFLRTLQSKYTIPVALIDGTTVIGGVVKSPRLHRLNVFVIETDNCRKHCWLLLNGLRTSIWWNSNAIFLMLDATPDADRQCSDGNAFMFYTKFLGLLNTQFICSDYAGRIVIMNANPFTPYAPKTWTFLEKVKLVKFYQPFYMFVRMYRKGGPNCEDLNFSKTGDIGGYPIHFIIFEENENISLEKFHEEIQAHGTDLQKLLYFAAINEDLWFRTSIVIALNATPILTTRVESDMIIICLRGTFVSDTLANSTDLERSILSQYQPSRFGVTQHTPHKTQLEKILTVIDKTSRIGMWIVYFVTFLFFKFFLGQSVVPAMLNIVRLTCNTGLTKLPTNLAPTIYLACLFGFVVTLQGIYTGNLATLLTTTIAYSHVNSIEDIADLGYTAYVTDSSYNKLAAHPGVDGRVIRLTSSDNDPTGEFETKCISKVLSDPLAVCIVSDLVALYMGQTYNLHISSDALIREYMFRQISGNNPLRRRIHKILSSFAENGLRREDERLERLRLLYVDDNDVRKNTFRRVMTLDDLHFAFVILIVGLACSLISFTSELVIFRVRLQIAKRRDRARARLAWGPTKKTCFSSLNFRFDPRRLFSKRR